MRTFGIQPDTRWLLVGAVCVAVCLPVALVMMAAERLGRK